MVNLPADDLSWEQDTFEACNPPGTQDAYENVPPNIRGAPTNYLRVSKENGAIEGQYLIDVSIPLAPQLMPDTVSEAENLSFYTKHGTITADVWVTGNNTSKRVSMKLHTGNGSVYAKIHDAFPESDPRHSLDLDLWSTYGDISLSLPRCFRGPMKIHTSHDRIAFSPAFKERTALLSDVQGVRMYFVGDRPRSGRWRGSDNTEEGEETAGEDGSPEEPLDGLLVDGWHSSVRIRWDGEPELPHMNQDGWTSFCMGTGRFFTTGRVN